MAQGRSSMLLRVLRPLLVGIALAYLATALIDKPAPVHFQADNPYAAKQAKIVEPQAEMVMDKNALKLGSPLSVKPENEGTSAVSVILTDGDIQPVPIVAVETEGHNSTLDEEAAELPAQ